MSKTVDEIRKTIDGMDNTIHDLLMKRAELVLKIGEEKRKNNVQVVQPDREIIMLRRLLARHKGPLPKEAVVRIWRELVGAVSLLQTGLKVVVTVPDDSSGLTYWDMAKDYFSSVLPMSKAGNPLAALAMVREGEVTFAVMPRPVDGQASPWWSFLLDESGDRPMRIVARLPLGDRNRADANPEHQAFVAARLKFDASGEDRSFIILELEQNISRAKVVDKVKEAGLEPRSFYTCAVKSRERTQHLIEVDKYIGPDDKSLGEILTKLDSPGGRAVAVGGYPVPPVYEDKVGKNAEISNGGIKILIQEISLTMSGAVFKKITIIGFGLIGSSLARVIRRDRLAEKIICGDISPDVCKKALELKLADVAITDLAVAVKGADIVVLAIPVGACGAVAKTIAGSLAEGAVVTDAGSVKQTVIDAVLPHMPPHAYFVPAHPVAGTEHSGPEAGFAELFQGRWCILTPLPDTPLRAIEKVTALWEAAGATVEIMEPKRHDLVLAITSHLPHLIAYSIVDTAATLEEHIKAEVIKYSASGFRDFTRIAASDPVMWRDIFLNNREAVLEILQRFNEDLTVLQKAIRSGDGEKLQDVFTRTRAIRRAIIQAKQS